MGARVRQTKPGDRHATAVHRRRFASRPRRLGLGAQAPPAALRGVIERVAPDRQSFDVKTRDGQERTLRLPADAKVARVVAASLADVKPGVYVGVAAVPGEGGALKALEVHLFPESMRGVGDGFRPFDLAPAAP